MAFLGTWNVSLDSDAGPFDFTLELTDQDGKVAAMVGSPDPAGGLTAVTDITKAGDALALRYEFEAQGQSMTVSLTLTPSGEGLTAVFEVGGGVFSAGGSAARAGN